MPNTVLKYYNILKAVNEKKLLNFDIDFIPLFLLDFRQLISIVDESLCEGDKLVVTLFYKKLEDFPNVSVGDVIRFHRLKVFTLFVTEFIFLSWCWTSYEPNLEIRDFAFQYLTEDASWGFLID